ncbi:S-layer homology domain-containing protein [Paenibacillus typhae]|uniref:S-layer homology domain-containing protein n=1 Tax=Paenibacillus typhae TaxID=1174501 RepID=A0A1G8XUL2_9BACL|nr:S-layer homology domain-containing protein [Paenibacillus typhae]SDJ93480.1 S-layer homology domain-containing protein [Paenibacillus typhae]
MKKVVAAVMAFMLLCIPAAVFAASSFTLQLSVKEALRGGSITLSGTTPGQADQVVVKVVSPAQTVFYIDVLTADGGAYTKRLAIPASQVLAPSGSYTVIAGSGGTTLTQTFTIPGGEEPGGGEPGTGTPTPAPTPTPSSTPVPTSTPNPSLPGGTGGIPASPAADVIPAGAGSASGAIVKPEAVEGGRYLVGADTLTQAMQQAAGSITLELPATAGETDVTLELPGKSMELMNTGNTALVLTDGVRTISFPAGAIKLSGDDQTRLRITFNAVWNDEAGALVTRAAGGDAAYAPTGVMISLTIESVNGSNTAGIHQLGQQAQVSLKLTPAQQAAINTELAGIYYLNGSSAEYMPGSIKGGTVTFKTGHFSTYALLVYDKSFTDLSGHWAEPAVKRLAAKHLVNGVDAEHYEPGRGITRAEFVALLMRAVERTGSVPSMVAPAPFSDVPSSSYYAQQAAEAAAMGIMNGYDGAFRPGDRITREEAAVALVHAAKHFSLPAGSQSNPAYADAQQISSWAAASVAEAGVSGLMQGDGTKFQPKKQVTRAEVAAMVSRLVQSGSSL